MFFEDVGGKRSQDELFIDCFVESGVPGSSRVETIQPLGQGILYFDVMAFDLALQPEGEGGVVDTGLPSHIDLLDVVLGEGLQHLRADIFLVVGVHY